MSDESCLTTDTVVQFEVKSKNSEAFGKHRPFYSGFSFYELFNRRFSYAVLFIQNCKMCLSKKISPILCWLFSLPGIASPWELFYLSLHVLKI